ncbi:MAG: hypothetical protein H7066_10985, partial [Cytophagaceae bacterium]|nr:hypothetical protein [Gemmatimonadaceae bacterium]
MRVLFVAGNERGAEERQARAWLARENGSDLRSNAITVDAIANQDLDDIDVVWVHAGAAVPVLSAGAIARLTTYHRGGGGVLLTLLATPLALS